MADCPALTASLPAMASLPHPRRIVISNLSLPSKLAGINGAEPAVQVLSENLTPTPELDGQAARRTVFTHESIPTSNTGLDIVPKEIPGGGIAIPQGANVRYNDLAPGGRVPMHRSGTTDYNIFLNGTMTLITPDEAFDPRTGKGDLTETLCHPGDVVMMRGALHATQEYTRSISIMIGAEPTTVEVEGTQEIRTLPDCFGD